MGIQELEENRRQKLELVKEHQNPYPERYQVTHELKDAIKLLDGTKDISVAGRILSIRRMGKLCFVNIGDIYGKLQVAIRRDDVGEEAYEFFRQGFDIGDFLGVSGEIFTTQTGEKTIRAQKLTFLGKAFKPLPEKFHGITDKDSCYRQRYLDLIMNEDTRNRFLLKFQMIKEIRRYLEDSGYLEVETPVLNDKPSGATARPFISHHNALDMEVNLRIAPETYLKRCIVGGIPKVFEFARCFRNEGMDATHLQDFTMLEGYCAYYNYTDNMKFLQTMLATVIKKVFGSSLIKVGSQSIDFSGEWRVVTFRELLIKDCGIDINAYSNTESLLDKIKEEGIELHSETPIEQLSKGNLIDLLYKKVSRPKIISPTFLTEHPTSLSPLARANDDNKEIVDRFQLIINGAEVINAYSELVDPVEQKKRLMEQALAKANGDEEAMTMDYDYITAMEYGMPPISGWGMGVDRFLQVITGQENLRDTVLFPIMRPLNN
ncbi:lysine--tRNA ligase [Lachnoclostridium phytofermentans]|uniref:Lysine--tRNA ligase n=1 Tax=Lachnoclostridium phytofermentans (strain ATCC 700394 / DSM 18823 / ISDg) TaxID=357809 RepID=A9KMI1_LACP7|nr:lysine--tRNA ligase [Lachnoclostridium phytofermentans]ABX42935.1 lysyl-tRNA synthetase [Lachnoclostridium phytofermentans ISDg]